MLSRQDGPRIVGLCGSLRETSFSYSTLKIAIDYLKEKDVNAEILELSEYDLPFTNVKRTKQQEDDVRDLTQRMMEANGFVFATPEYHGSISGFLKNTLDLLPVPAFAGKYIAGIGISGGAQGAGKTLMTIRQIARNIHAWVLPADFTIGAPASKFDEERKLKDKGLQERLEKLMDDLVEHSQIHKDKAEV